MNFIYTLCLLFSKLIPFRALRRRVRGALLWRKEHPKVAHYLNQNYVLPFLNGELKHYEFEPLKEFENDKIIWQFWFQGAHNVPALVQKCFDSVREQMGGEYQIIILDENNLNDYINFPPFILQKLKEGTLSKTFFSDLLRVCLLATYGGVWLDATIYLSGKIGANLLAQDFFAFQRSATPPLDEKVWKKFNYGYFVWDDEVKIRLLNSFLIAKAKHPLMLALQDILFAFWQNEQKARHYFMFQIIFDLLISNEKFAPLNCAVTNDTDAHLLQLHAKECFDAALWSEICQKTTIHKLTYFKTLPQNSMAMRILGLENEILQGKADVAK